jgi:LPXTG-motif cell wall-anchored protein
VLAKTGVSVTGPAVGGVAAIALGAGLLVVSRRRPVGDTGA